MQKTLKRTVALLLALMLCLSAMPFSAFAADAQPNISVPSEVEAVVEPDEPELTAAPEVDDSSSPRGSPEEQEETPAATDTEVSEETAAEPDEMELTPGTQLDVDRVWPAAVRLMQARSAAAYGTSGTLYVGDYCFTESVGMLPTLGESVGLTPIETMRYGSNNVAAYCLEHARFVP